MRTFEETPSVARNYEARNFTRYPLQSLKRNTICNLKSLRFLDRFNICQQITRSEQNNATILR